MRLSSTLISSVSKTSSDGDSTKSLGRLKGMKVFIPFASITQGNTTDYSYNDFLTQDALNTILLSKEAHNNNSISSH